jgi:hypothetical protein
MGVKSDKKNVDQMPITHPFGFPPTPLQRVLATSNLQYIKVESDLAKITGQVVYFSASSCPLYLVAPLPLPLFFRFVVLV